MKTVYLAAVSAALLLCAQSAAAAVLRVGNGQRYSTIQAASNAANPGDVIELSPGVYNKGATFFDAGLIVRRAPGAAAGSVIVRGGTVGGKALFVTKGANMTVDGIRFENARVPDRNGAGIRSEGANLTVLNCRFKNNENGILAAGPLQNNVLTVKNSRFEDTRSPAGASVLTHAIYVGQSISGAVIENNVFTRTTTGHHLKSRAVSTTVTGNTFDDAGGTNSYSIDIPEGGRLYVTDNVFTKGAKSPNANMIAYGFERFKGGAFRNPTDWIWVADNRVTNRRTGATTFFNNRSDFVAELANNQLSSSGGRLTLAAGPYQDVTGQERLTPQQGAPAPEVDYDLEAGWIPEFEIAAPIPVPAPPAMVLFVMGAAALGLRRRQLML